MKFLTLQNRLNNHAWYIVPNLLLSLREAVQSLPNIQSGDFEDMVSLIINQRAPLSIDSNGIAIIDVTGILGNDLSPVEKMLGLCDYADVIQDVADAQSAGCKAILLDMDSGGGEAQNALEAGALIAEAKVPVASFTASMDCSAAYSLSVSAGRKFVSPSSFSGSIGTVMPCINQEGLWTMMGLKYQPISGAGEEQKGAGMGPSLSDSQRAFLQDQVNEMSQNFQNHVANFRAVDFSQLAGASFLGEKAVALNLADKIGTFDSAYQWLLNRI